MANSGVVVVTELRKFVNGVDTGQVKPNVVGDPDYVAPYLGIQTCLPNVDPVTTTTSTSTTTTTTGVSLKAFQLSTTSYASTIQACSSTQSRGVFYSGKNNTPSINDTFYLDSAGQSLLTQGIYHAPTESSSFTINSSGILTSKSACSSPTTTTTTSTTTTTTSTTTTTTTTAAPGYWNLRVCSNGSLATQQVLDDGSLDAGVFIKASNGICYETDSLQSNQSGGLVTVSDEFDSCQECLDSVASTPCYTYSIQNNDLSQNLTYQYRDCDGNLIQDQVVLADSGTPDFCAEEGSVSRQSGTSSWVLTTEATTCTVGTPTPPVAPPVAPPVVSYASWRLQPCAGGNGQNNQYLAWDSSGSIVTGDIVLASDAECYTLMEPSNSSPTLSWVSEFNDCSGCVAANGGF